MLKGLDSIPWENLEHAYGAATDVPDLLRSLLDADPKVRSTTLRTLYGNIFHQGTRYPATPYVIPFLIEMCATSTVPNRGDLLRYWGDLIVGYFSIQERPVWGDGTHIYIQGEVQNVEMDDQYTKALHRIYQESLQGYELLFDLLSGDEDVSVRAESAWVLACLPTEANETIPRLDSQIKIEASGWVRAAIAFALGELGAINSLRRLLNEDPFPATQCMAACELARIGPSEELIEPLLGFVMEPIAGYENIPGAGGKSTGDAAFSISHLPSDMQLRAIPAICDRLDQTRSFETMPLVQTLLSAAFNPVDKPITKLNNIQRQVLMRMVNTEELWAIGNLIWVFKSYGLPHKREECAKLMGITVENDEALAQLRSALSFADIGFLDKARQNFEKALEIDPNVFERVPSPDECWLLCAKAFAETNSLRALEALERACSINPQIDRRIAPTWHLAELTKKKSSE